MAHSTTSKHIFALTKYSRAIFGQSNNTQNSQSLKGDCDWHHHTQPTLRLLVELRKSAQSIPESLRLRIVWTTDKSNGKTGKRQALQENIIFEDIDLLLIRKHIHPFPTQGLPLKAVFRDKMIGIRYLPPQAKSNAASEYRRFQITFQLSNDANTLVEAIRDVCPCKPSPINNPAPAVPIESAVPSSAHIGGGGISVAHSSQQTQALLPPQFQSQLAHGPPDSRVGLFMTQRRDEHLPLSQPTISADLPVEFTIPFYQSRQDSSISTTDPGTHVYSASALDHQSLSREALLSDSLSSPFYPQALTYSLRPLMANKGLTIRNLKNTQSDPNVSRSMPLMTPPASSHAIDSSRSSETNMPSRKATFRDATTDAGSPVAETGSSLMESLYESCRLDRLARDELEQLIAHIVREDGFTELLEKVDSLWQLKAVVNL